jgi:hypothetical protein
MLDRIFAPALAFLVLVGGTVMIALAMFTDLRSEPVAPAPEMPLVEFERVEVTAPRSVLQSRSDTEPSAPARAAQATPEGRGILLHGNRE